MTEAYHRKLPTLAVTASQGFSRIGNLSPQFIDRSVQPVDAVKMSVQVQSVRNEKDEFDCTVKIYKKDPKDWGYKKSPFQTGDKVILSAVFNVKKGFDEAKSAEVLEKRKTMGHFKAPSAGSAFKNKPEEGIIAGKIIDECGLKGFSCGGAQIAPWHGNFIINPEKKASCADIKALVEKVQETVLQKTGIKLECEILFV